MADSLRDQLLKAGFTSTPKPKGKGGGKPGKRSGKPRRAPKDAGNGSGEPDLARAYALRAKAESAERRRQKAEAEREARERKERKRKLQEVLKDAALNSADAELMRHFEYGGKIRRVHVDADQLARINAGELAVVQLSGRYLLVSLEVADKVHAIAPEHIALRVDPSAADEGDDGVPDDLVW
jgi:uncharacterized protein YaiL (DUF2058 family)